MIVSDLSTLGSKMFDIQPLLIGYYNVIADVNYEALFFTSTITCVNESRWIRCSLKYKMYIHLFQLTPTCGNTYINISLIRSGWWLYYISKKHTFCILPHSDQYQLQEKFASLQNRAGSKSNHREWNPLLQLRPTLWTIHLLGVTAQTCITHPPSQTLYINGLPVEVLKRLITLLRVHASSFLLKHATRHCGLFYIP